jgi:hypothetical protein
MPYSYLIEVIPGDKDSRRWSPMIKGGVAAAEKAMKEDSRICECSIYNRDSRFIKTVRRPGAKRPMFI